MDRYEELTAALAAEKATVQKVLLLLADHVRGRARHLSVSIIYREIAKHFGLPQAHCFSCERFLGREHFPAWRKLPVNKWPRNIMKLRCEECIRGIVRTQEGHIPKRYAVTIAGQIYSVAARQKNEAVALLLRSKRRKLDASLWNREAGTYNGVPIDWKVEE